MNTLIFYRRRAERLAQLLDEADGGRRHHVRDRVDEDLAELVAVGHRITALQPSIDARPEPDFRAGLRAMLIATAERDGIGVTAGPDAAADGDAGREPRRIRPALAAQRARARGAIVVGVVAGAVAVSGMSAASENAVPGDALYGVKRSTERAQLALAGSDLSRGQLSLDFARTRLGEAGTVRGGSGFSTVLDDMDADTRQGVKLMTTSAAQRKDAAALDAIRAFVVEQRPAVATLVATTTGGNRHRAQQSLALLDAVDQRADSLRRALPCGPDGSPGADALGPLPHSCVTASAPSYAEPPHWQTPASPPSVERTTAPATPGSPTPDSDAGTPSPTPSATPAPAGTDEGLFGGLGRLLEGILD
ncbi:hypothetical protein SAMN05444365_101550 [Micromonospora pattaloongensis]|uniref:DUF5667 domain-containing protein n=1 Tax=Micromonospora pattaloongensis TaxID=405436 RepID=A0A1H3GSX6_9ACTN|nr:hypothetical protein SAMN05444365_101550 [Micromonospora pattaloongensis]